jgi:hypothetical protein
MWDLICLVTPVFFVILLVPHVLDQNRTVAQGVLVYSTLMLQMSVLPVIMAACRVAMDLSPHNAGLVNQKGFMR